MPAAALRRSPSARPITLHLPDDAGIVLPSGSALPDAARQAGLAGCTSTGEPRAVYPRTLLWDPAAPLRLDLVPSGFHLLDYWHAAAPLYDYNTLAFQHGTFEERRRTAAVIHDLRVPLFETRALFLRQCPEVDALLDAWARERENGADERLAFQRAVWQTRALLILPLPITWIEGKQP